MRRRSSGTFVMLENPPKTAIDPLSALCALRFGRRLRREHDHRAARRLDLEASALTEFVSRNREWLREVPVPEDLDLVHSALDESRFTQLDLADFPLRVETLQLRDVERDDL